MSKQQATNSDKPPIPDIVMDVPMTFERFPIPNYVKVRYGGSVLTNASDGKVSGAHIESIPEDILKKLVDAFIAELYEKAGKENPYIGSQHSGVIVKPGEYVQVGLGFTPVAPVNPINPPAVAAAVKNNGVVQFP